MRYLHAFMRRESVVATTALIAALALAGLPGPAGSRSPSNATVLQPAAFTSMVVPANVPAQSASGPLDVAQRSAGFLGDSGMLTEPGAAPAVPTKRPKVDQPSSKSGEAWKQPKYTISGYATFYDNGTTAMRLPRGTVVRICGGGGCIERTVTDYGPVKKIRVVDLYRPDFFQICGCSSWSGTTWVTVSIY
jgi:hypothetical protein